MSERRSKDRRDNKQPWLGPLNQLRGPEIYRGKNKRKKDRRKNPAPF